jgi:hypothetical protein
MRELRESKLMGFYAQWLAPEERSRYLEDARAFFAKH